jgi:carboxymethylenebutenolidase
MRTPGLIIVVILLSTIGYYFWTINMPPQPNTNAGMLAERKQKIVEQDVAYAGDQRGFFVHPEATGSYPGIILVHEWWGLNDSMKEQARTLASEGYNVFAVDLFGKVATTQDDARAQIGELKQDEATKNMSEAYDYLKSHGATKMAVYGYCFGGGQAMQFSLAGKPLNATVMYYGTPVTDVEKLKVIKWPLLSISGDKDASITPDLIHSFDTALTSAGVTHEVKIYEGVGHAFANPSGQNFAPDTTKDAWAKTLIFLAENLK